MNRKAGLTDEEFVEGRLRHFINRYYRIKIFQGLIVTLSAGLLILLALIIFGNFRKIDTVTRNIGIIAGSALWLGILAIFILKPLARRMGWIRGLNFKEASNIIRQKHKSVEDRIINIIELTREKEGQNNKLYDYAIAQKTDNIRDINFDDAVSLRKLGVFMARLAVLLAICTGAFLFWPDFVKKGIGTIWAGNEQIAAMKEIKFVILNDSLEVESGRDFLLRFRLVSEFPVENVAILMGSAVEKADPVGSDYEFLFKAVNSSIIFRIGANSMTSVEYELKTLKKPEIAGIQLKLIPPSYTGLESSVVEGDGNAEVPAGTRVIWTIRTVNTDELLMMDETDSVSLKGKGNTWNFDKKIIKNTDYELICKNINGLFINYSYKISLVKDLYPTIDISESADSTVSSDVYVQGIIQDDYGFSKLEVVENKLGKETVKEIKIKESAIYENFYYTLVPDSNNTIYYFRVWDNDLVTGPKFTESRKITLRTNSKTEIENINSQLVDSISNSMTDGMNAVEMMEKKLSEFRIEQIVGDLKPWEIQEKMKELNDLKKQVEDFINDVTEANQEYTENEKLLSEDTEFVEKAKEIQELMESLLDDELKDLMKQFEELAKEFNAQKAEDLTEKMEDNLEKLKAQMEMSLELLKKYNMEKELIKQTEKLNQLADSVKNDQSDNGDSKNNLKEEFKKWEEEYQNKVDEDKQFNKPMGLDSMGKERDEVRKAADELNKKEGGKPSEDKKSKAAESLKKLAKKMQSQLGMMSGEAIFVDLEDLRQIRNSLNDFSKRQEELNGRIANMNSINPTFTAVIKEQKSLEDKFIPIRDSLKSIGYKQPVVAKMIGSELFHVETSLKNLFVSYAENRASVVRIEQNKIMSEVNSIAVKLDELISSQENAKGSGEGNRGFMDRKKPKDGQSSGSEQLGKSKSEQESLKEQLKNSIEKMKSGNNGKKERGEMAKMLGQREMMRKALEKLAQGGGLGTQAKEKANEALNMMKEVEKDIIYNRLSDQTMQKDNLIRTKLLEAENAEKERENENRRESKEFKGSFEPNRKDAEKVINPNKAQEQMLKYNELKLKRFYQEKYLKYIESTKK